MISANEIKKMIMESGADLCGIACVDRFDNAPKGFHPNDALPSCKSIIVFAKKFLNSTLRCKSAIPYTIVRNILSDEMDRMAVEFCNRMENQGVIAIPTGTIGPTEFDESTGRYRNIVSSKHCAEKAGLGLIGKNSLLITPKYGNMVWLSVILTDAPLEADDVLAGSLCLDGCSLCVDVCPAKAIGNPEVDQMKCWNHAYKNEGKGDFWIKCYKCREICPHCFGVK